MNEIKRRFKYSYFNKMLYSSLSNDDVWFLNSLINNEFFDIMTEQIEEYYMFYVSIYLFYLIKKEEKTSEKLKKDILSILEKNSDNDDIFTFNWYKSLKFFYENKEEDFFKELLNKLFYFKNLTYEIEPFYKISGRIVFNSNDIAFNDKLIITSYLELLLNLNFDLNNFKNKINKECLNNDQVSLFEKMIEKENLEKIKYDDNGFLCFYKLKKIFNIERFLKAKNDENDYENKNINESDKLQEEDTRKILENFFTDLKNEPEIYIKDENMGDANLITNYLFTKDPKSLNDLFNLRRYFIYDFNKLLARKLRTSTGGFKTKEDLKKEISAKSKDEIVFYKNFNHIAIVKSDDQNSLLNKLDEMKTVNVYYDENLVWKKDAIKVMYDLDKSKIIYRKLNDDEINEIIEARYKTSNGFYTYKYNKNITQFVSRDELFNEIQNNFCYISVSYNYYIYVDTENIYKFF